MTTETPGPPPGESDPLAPATEPFTAAVEIAPDLPGLEVWLDGQDQELATPAVLSLAGEVGDSRTLELRRDGEVLASLDLTLGPGMQGRWAPALAPAEEVITISSQPAGARVALDGETLEGVTPLDVALSPGREYQLALTLEGHEPAGWSFDLDRLSAEQRDAGELHFVLTVSVPPAELVVLASYPVTVEVAGRRRTGEGEIRLSLPPGSHTVELSAPRVFYGDSRSVVLESEESRTLELPRTVTIPVAAEGRCRLSIDGREVGDLPARVELTVGAHTFRFEWEGGLVKEQRHNIGLSTQRIFEVRPA